MIMAVQVASVTLLFISCIHFCVRFLILLIYSSLCIPGTILVDSRHCRSFFSAMFTLPVVSFEQKSLNLMW